MVKIRLRRVGARKRPFYRIVAIDSRAARGGRALEFLGTYDPNQVPERVVIQSERLQSWVSRGARLSPTVKSLVRRAKRRAAATAAS